MEGSFEEPRPAADTVEILPTPEIAESEPAVAAARLSWPAESGAEAIETASLPALAGDPPNSVGEGELATAGPAGAASHEALQPHASTQPPEPEPEGQTGSPPTAEAEQGVPYVSEMEREIEPVAAATELQHQQDLEPMPPHPVETVTEKPANPRRGWWQRLIQS
jgi:hypothetical protein